jgi:hypothetical protein
MRRQTHDNNDDDNNTSDDDDDDVRITRRPAAAAAAATGHAEQHSTAPPTDSGSGCRRKTIKNSSGPPSHAAPCIHSPTLNVTVAAVATAGHRRWSDAFYFAA